MITDRINGNLANIETGGRNYLLNSNFHRGAYAWYGSHSSQLEIVSGSEIPGTPPPEVEYVVKNGSAYTYQTVMLEPGAVYTVSAWVYITLHQSITRAPSLEVWYLKDNAWNSLASTTTSIYDKWHKLSLTFIADFDYPKTIIGFGQIIDGEVVTYSTLYKLERSKIVSDWSPNINEVVDKADENFSILQTKKNNEYCSAYSGSATALWYKICDFSFDSSEIFQDFYASFLVTGLGTGNYNCFGKCDINIRLNNSIIEKENSCFLYTQYYTGTAYGDITKYFKIVSYNNTKHVEIWCKAMKSTMGWRVDMLKDANLRSGNSISKSSCNFYTYGTAQPGQSTEPIGDIELYPSLSAEESIMITDNSFKPLNYVKKMGDVSKISFSNSTVAGQYFSGLVPYPVYGYFTKVSATDVIYMLQKTDCATIYTIRTNDNPLTAIYAYSYKGTALK